MICVEPNKTIDVVLRRRHLLSKSDNCLVRAEINCLLILLIIIDFKYSIIGSSFDSKLFENSVLILDIIIGLILIINIIYDFGLWFWRQFLITEIELTSSQMKAFGVKINEIGFKESKPTTPSSKECTPFQAIGSVSPVFEMSYSSDLDKHSSLNSTHLSFSMSPFSNNLSCGQLDSSLNTTSTSWEYNRNSSPINSGFNDSDLLNDSKTNFVRLRRNPNKQNSIQSMVTNERQLDEYLKHFDIKEQRIEEISDADKRRQTNGSNTSWNNRLNNSFASFDDNNQNSYQMAVDSPLRLNNIDSDSFNTSAPTSKAMDSLLTKLKINEIIMNQWIENIRKWLSQTIICRLVEQIDKINDKLIKSGNFDALIGETNIQTLKQLSALKKSELSTLDSVLPFLELTSNQHYFVQRIRDLSKGGCIGKFIWNSGGSYNSKPWNEEMLTDSVIVMHLFRTYMDLRLPSDPNSLEGKSFTNYYFRSITGPAPKSVIHIIESKVSPPHYDVSTGEDSIWKLPIGRNNLFHAILVFLDAIKAKQLGHLGRINLGSSGINILWVIHR